MALGLSDGIDLIGRIADLVKKGATLEANERIVELREVIAASELSEEEWRWMNHAAECAGQYYGAICDHEAFA